MKLTIKLYGITKEIIGHSEMEYSLPAAVHVSDFRRMLEHEYPQLSRLTSLAIAVNGEYARQELPLAEGDEVVLIPPVSGG